MKSARRPLPGLRCGVGLLVAAGTFALYLSTLAPTVMPYRYPGMRDVGVLQIKAALLAVPDVTGYPTWVVLTHLFTYLPFGDEAYRANLASAAYAAGAVLLVYLICLKLTGRISSAAAGALLFGASRTFWSQALIAEVYTLNALFVSATLLALLAWRERRRERNGDRYLLLVTFLAGLSLTDHLTSGLLLPAAVLFVALTEWRKLLDPRLVLKGAGLFILGLTPYLFLPVRASMDPPFSGADPTTLANFWALVSGGGFKSVMFVFGPAELPGRLAYYFGRLSQQFYPLLLVFVALGAAHQLVRDRAALALFGSLYVGWLIYALEYDIGDVYVYFIPTYLILCVWISVGFGSLPGALNAVAGKLPAAAYRPVAAVAAALMLAAVLTASLANYKAVDLSGDYQGRRIVETVEAKAEPNAVVLQHRSPLPYMQLVEGHRTDLTLASSPFPRLNGRLKNLETPQKYLSEGRTVYVLSPHPGAVRIWEQQGYRLTPVQDGMLYEIGRE